MSEIKTYIAKTILLVREREARGENPYVQPGEEIQLDDLRALALMQNGAVEPKFNMDHYEVVFNRDTNQNELVPKKGKKAGKVPGNEEEDGGLANG